MRSDMHPSEYLIPLIHQRQRTQRDMPFPEAAPTIEKDDKLERDPFYANIGVLLYLHYLRNFPEKKGGAIQIRSSLLYRNKVVEDSNRKECKWMSDQVPFYENLKQVPENMPRIQEIVNLQDIDRNDRVCPLIQTNTWHKNFYSMLWDNNLQYDLYLVLEVIENKDMYPTGVTVLKINKEDGTLKYGSHELPVYKFPLKDITYPEKNEPLNYNIVFILNEAKPVMQEDKPVDKYGEIEKRLESLRFSTEEDKHERLSEFDPDDITKKEDEKEAFIPNTLKQHEEEPFKHDEIIVLFIDSGRYLPENISLTQVSCRAVNREGQIVMGPISSK